MWLLRSFLAVFAFTALVARADTLLYTISGTYPSTPVTQLDDNFNILGQATIPVTAAVAPGAAYSFQFSLSTPVTPAFNDDGEWTANTLLTYSLNDVLVSSAPNTIVFFVGTSGGFLIPEYAVTIGQDQYYWSWAGPQLFGGATGNPTLTTGTFAVNGVGQGEPTLQFVGIGPTLWELPDNTGLTVTDAPVVTSEPRSQTLLAIAGLVCISIKFIKPKQSKSA